VNAPAITITSSPDDFGRVATGEASGSISFTATNTSGVSTGPLTQSITGTGAASFKLVSSTCVGATLAPAASCSVIVRFIPATVGAKSALLALSGGPGETGNATLLGTAIVPPVLTYTSVAFGNVFDGDSKDATVLVSNPIEAQTSGPITFSMTSTNPSCATSGPASPCFTLLPFAAGDCVSGTTVLGPGATCNVRVHFTPLTTIGSVQGSLAVSANPGSSPALHDVPLTGTGLTTITVNPTLYDFGQVNVFNAAYETFTITNVSDENQSSVNAFFTGVADALAIIDDSCFNGPLAPHATCTIAVQYVPEANGDFTDAFLDISFADGFAQAEITGTSPN
jgi:trimeric autotransporter adhesin